MSDTRKPQLSFDDPKPAYEKRKMQQIFILPSLKAEIDRRRGNTNRSVYIERLLRLGLQALQRDDDPKRRKAPDRD